MLFFKNKNTGEKTLGSAFDADFYRMISERKVSSLRSGDAAFEVYFLFELAGGSNSGSSFEQIKNKHIAAKSEYNEFKSEWRENRNMLFTYKGFPFDIEREVDIVYKAMIDGYLYMALYHIRNSSNYEQAIIALQQTHTTQVDSIIELIRSYVQGASVDLNDIERLIEGAKYGVTLDDAMGAFSKIYKKMEFYQGMIGNVKAFCERIAERFNVITPASMIRDCDEVLLLAGNIMFFCERLNKAIEQNDNTIDDLELERLLRLIQTERKPNVTDEELERVLVYMRTLQSSLGFEEIRDILNYCITENIDITQEDLESVLHCSIEDISYGLNIGMTAGVCEYIYDAVYAIPNNHLGHIENDFKSMENDIDAIAKDFEAVEKDIEIIDECLLKRSVFDEACMRTEIRGRYARDNEGKSITDTIMMTEDEEEWFGGVVRRGAMMINDAICAYGHNLTEQQLRIADKYGVSVAEFGLNVFGGEAFSFWGDVEELIYECLVLYVVKEWYRINRMIDDYTIENEDFERTLERLKFEVFSVPFKRKVSPLF